MGVLCMPGDNQLILQRIAASNMLSIAVFFKRGKSLLAKTDFDSSESFMIILKGLTWGDGVRLELKSNATLFAEENVDRVVAGGAVEAVVPLLSYFKYREGEPLQSRYELDSHTTA